MADDFSAYGWGQGLSDMLGGYLGETGKIREENERKNQQQLQIEQTALQHLMTSDDPNVKAAAITSWLTPRKSGPGPLAKWYNQQSAHPAFEQVQTILGQGTPGMAPWMTPEQKATSEYRGATSGRAAGIFDTYQKYTGQKPPQSFVERTLASLGGGAQRQMALQPGVVGRKNAEGGVDYENGFFDASSGEYYDSSYTPIYDGVDFRRTGVHTAGSGDITWRQRPDGKFDVLQKSDPTRVLGTTTQPYLMPPAPAPAIIQPTPGEPAKAVTGRGSGPFTATPITGTERPAETLRETYDRLTRQKTEIERQAYLEDPKILGLDRDSYLRALEFWAQKNGYPSYQSIVDRLTGLGQQLEAPPNQQPQRKPQKQGAAGPPPGPLPTDTTATPTGNAPRQAAPVAGRGKSRAEIQSVLDLIKQERTQASPVPPR